MPVFGLGKDKIEVLSEIEIDENRLRTIIENANLEPLEKGLILIDRNVPAGTGFIDTFAVGSEGRPVIIEYETNERELSNALVQALDYSDFVFRNPEIFSKFIQEKLKNKKIELDFDEIRIILVIPVHSERLINASHLIEAPIKIIKYSYLKGGTNESLHMEIIYDSSVTIRQREPIAYTIDEHFTGRAQQMKSTFDYLLEQAQKFGNDVKVSAKKFYIAFTRNYNFAVIHVYSDRLDIGIRLPDESTDERLFDATGWGFSRINKIIKISKKEDVDDKAINWLKQSYESS